MMMLNIREGQLVVSRALFGQFRRKVFGVHIRGQQARPVIVKTGIELQVLLIILERRNVLQITLVLGENRGPILQNAEGGFQLAPKSQQVGRIFKADGNGTALGA